MIARLITAWRTRTPREQRLLGAFGVALAIVGATLITQAVGRDAAALRTRVARAERRLTAARVLAGRLEGAESSPPDEAQPRLVSLVESAVGRTVGAERLARLEQGPGPEDATEARLVGVDLTDVIRVLSALEEPSQRLIVRDLDLRRHPDEPARYDAALVVIRERTS